MPCSPPTFPLNANESLPLGTHPRAPAHPLALSANMPRRSAREHHTRRVSSATATCFSGDSA
jgi:hypothetical protein